MDPPPALPAPQLFSLAGQNVLITGATRGMFLLPRMRTYAYSRSMHAQSIPTIH